MQSIQLTTLDVDSLRTRLRKMSDKELRDFGTAARYMVSPTTNMGKPPLPGIKCLSGEYLGSFQRTRPPNQRLEFR